jgi:hypothetical protein
MKRFTLVLLFLGCLACQAQETTLKSPVAKGTLIVKITPTSLIGFYPALQFAGEYFYKENRSLQLELGWMNYGFSFGGLGVRNLQGQRIRLEHRNYFTKSKKWYVAPELHAQVCMYNTNQSFATMAYDSAYQAMMPIESHREDLGVRKFITSANVKFGVEHRPKLFPMVRVNLYYGLGVRYIDTRWTTSPTGEYWAKDPHLSPLAPDFFEGKTYTFNIVAGLQIGFQVR